MKTNEYEQREIFQNNLNRLINKSAYNQKEIADFLHISPQTLNTWTRGKAIPRMSKLQLLADFFNVNKTDLLIKYSPTAKENNVANGIRIPVLGSVPAGIPIEAIEDIVDWEEIPSAWLNGDQEYFALRVTGTSMFPKYLDGDTIIVQKQDDCESGQDCVVYVNGYDATLKKVIKNLDHIILQPLNPEFEPRIYDYNDQERPVKIAGVVVELRRKI